MRSVDDGQCSARAVVAIGLACVLAALTPGCAGRQTAARPDPPLLLLAAEEIRLLDPGAEPRVPLRFHLPAGHHAVQRTVMRTTVAVTAGSEPEYVRATPVSVSTAVDVAELAPDGTASLVFSAQRSETGEAGIRPPAGAPPRASGDGTIAGILGLEVRVNVTPRGFRRNVRIVTPPEASGQLRSLVQGTLAAAEQAAVMFPEEPVGRGARWQYRTTVESSPLKPDQFGVFTLLWREGDRVWLGLEFEERSPPPLPPGSPDPPGDSSGRQSRLEGHGSGHMELTLGSPVVSGGMTVKRKTVIDLEQSHRQQVVALQLDLTFAHAGKELP